ncbi:hypothetical protein [Vallitalea guaymasensis]|uniref:hypothetical protein n=1 Tax=Vallitalea guaymasensis TaxID=1185412 RepID=UPI00272BA29F|nr:hypothetical protein [Vallitalea guaymasensis]
MKKNASTYIVAYMIILLIGALNYIIFKYSANYKPVDYNFHNSNFYIRVLLLPMIGRILFGMSIGLESLLPKVGKHVKLKMNTTRLLIMGIPSLLISLIKILYVFGIIHYYFIRNETFLLSALFQILFGYIIISSIEKKEITN